MNDQIKVNDDSRAEGKSLLNDGLCVARQGDAKDIVAAFYKHLLERNEPLPAAFTTVLNDNLWDLYES